MLKFPAEHTSFIYNWLLFKTLYSNLHGEQVENTEPRVDRGYAVPVHVRMRDYRIGYVRKTGLPERGHVRSGQYGARYNFQPALLLYPRTGLI